MGQTYKSYEALGTRPPPPIFHEMSATEHTSEEISLDCEIAAQSIYNVITKKILKFKILKPRERVYFRTD